MAADSPSYFILYLFTGVGNCIIVILALYNLVALIGVMRAETEKPASGISKASWGIGCLSALLIPCSPLLASVALIMSRIEIGRVYRDESPLSSATPARMGSVNGGISLLVFALVFLGAVINFLL